MTDFSTITACGECCVGCSKKIDGLCPGCIEADGHVPEWAQSGMCKVHACCKEHNARFCGLCSEFPCDKLPQLISWNPDIIQHLSALQDEYIINGCPVSTQSEGWLRRISRRFLHFVKRIHSIIDTARHLCRNRVYEMT